MPQNYEVPESYLSPHMQKVRDDLKITKEGQKLICDLGPKKNYVISAYTLKTYLRAGVKITGDYNKIRFNIHYQSITKLGEFLGSSIRFINTMFTISAIRRGIVFRQAPIIKEQMIANQTLRREYQQKKMTSSADCIKRLSNRYYRSSDFIFQFVTTSGCVCAF